MKCCKAIEKLQRILSHRTSNAKVDPEREGEGERESKGGKSSGREGGEGKWRMHL